jgi:hypothetical protein
MLALDRRWAQVSLAGALSSLAAAQGQQQVLPGRCEHVDLFMPGPTLLRDFDGDGHLDLLTCGQSELPGGNDVLSLLRGDGAGGLGSGQTFPSNGTPAGMGAGDFDEDGDLDLALASPGLAGYFELQLGDGSGGFAGSTLFPSGGKSGRVEVADLDGDGHLDLALANPGSYPFQIEYTVSIVLGTGAGGFLAPSVHELGLGTNPVQPLGFALGDLDQDGDEDIVAGGWNGLAVLLSDGQGGVERKLRYDPTDTELRAVACGDLDGDGYPDVVAGGLLYDPGGGFDVYRATGNGSLALTASIATDAVVSSLALGDIDGDGALDVLAGSIAGGLQHFRGDGNGALGAPQSWPTPGLQELALGDLDEDASLDLVASIGNSHHVLVLRNDGSGGFDVARTEPARGGTWVTADDLNGDGQHDLVVSSRLQPEFLVRPASGQGQYGPAVISTLTFLVHGHVAAQMTGDAHLDVLASDEANGDLVLLEGDGQCGVSELARWPGPGRWPCTPAVVDLDRDGDLDAALASAQAGALAVWLGDGQGGLIQSGTWSVGGEPTGVVASDLDEDGLADLLVSNAPLGSLTLLRGDGMGGFGGVQSFDFGDWVSCVALSDLNVDGHWDVIAAFTNNGVWVLLGDGQGGLGPPNRFDPRVWSPRALISADVDGDGWTDLLVGGAGGTPELSLLLGDGTGGLSSSGTFSSYGYGTWSMALTDLDHDGRLDVVTSPPFPLKGLSIYTNLLPDLPICTTEEVYCEGKLNSAGCLPRICSTGSPSVSGLDDFFMRAEQVVANCPGVLLWSHGSMALPFMGGLLCVAPPIVRTTAQVSGGVPGVHDCAGTYAFHLDHGYMASHGLVPGVQLFGQYWSRDPKLPTPFDAGLTDALRVTIQP